MVKEKFEPIRREILSALKDLKDDSTQALFFLLALVPRLIVAGVVISLVYLAVSNWEWIKDTAANAPGLAASAWDAAKSSPTIPGIMLLVIVGLVGGPLRGMIGTMAIAAAVYLLASGGNTQIVLWALTIALVSLSPFRQDSPD